MLKAGEPLSLDSVDEQGFVVVKPFDGTNFYGIVVNSLSYLVPHNGTRVVLKVMGEVGELVRPTKKGKWKVTKKTKKAVGIIVSNVCEWEFSVVKLW